MKATIDNLPELPAEAGECEILYCIGKEGDLFVCGKAWVKVLGEHKMESLIARPIKPKRLEWGPFDDGHSWSACEQYLVSLCASGRFRCDMIPGEGEFATAEAAREACQAHADNQKRPSVAEQSKPEPTLPQAWLDAGWRLKPGCRVVRDEWKTLKGDLYTLRSSPPPVAWSQQTADGLTTAGHHDHLIHIRCDDSSITCPVERPKAESPVVAINWPADAIALVKDRSGFTSFYLPKAGGSWDWQRHTGPDPFPPGMPWDKCFLINPAVTKP